MKKTAIEQRPENGFVLPMVIVLVLLLGLISAARLTQYQFRVLQRMEQANRIKTHLALDSALAWLQNTLQTNATFHGPETWTIPSPLQTATTNWVTVAGDGHRFVIEATYCTPRGTNSESRIVTLEDIHRPKKYKIGHLKKRKGQNSP